MNPLAAVVIVGKLALCAVITFFGVYWIMSNWFERRLRAWEAAILGAGLLIVAAHSVPMALAGGLGLPLLLGAVFGTAGLLRLVGWRANRRVSRRLEDAEVATYQEAVEYHPENPHAHSLLAEAYRRTDETEQALREYEEAVRLDPSLKQERYWIRRLRDEIDRRESKALYCPRCGTPRREREMVCRECGREYSRLEVWAHDFQKMSTGDKATRVAGGLAAAVLVLGALAAAPRPIKGLIVLLVLIVPAVVVVRERGRRSGRG